MASFKVHGPYPLSFERRKGGRTLRFDNFWTDESDAAFLGGERGCYVFSIVTGGGVQPIYVGKATRTFKQEAFNATNKHKYNNGFSEYAIGTPVMFFVVHPKQKGPTNAKEIGHYRFRGTNRIHRRCRSERCAGPLLPQRLSQPTRPWLNRDDGGRAKRS